MRPLLSYVMNKIGKPKTSTENGLGPLVDDGVPYSTIDDIELNLIMKKNGISCSNRNGKILNGLNGDAHLQYGNGSHACPPRRIIGSEDITATSNLPNQLSSLILLYKLTLNG